LNKSKFENASRKSISYKPGLDGLRGLAVLLVFIYHSSYFTTSPIRLAPSGYLGVDLFFVLSGYLITTLLIGEWQQTSGICLKRFWLQRARRLIPAVTLLLLIGSILSVTVLRHNGNRHSYIIDMWSTFSYVANWRFIFSDSSYFAQFGSPSILRHMWSLGIEEQFYLIWPVIVICIVKFSRARSSTIGELRRTFQLGLLTISIIGAIASASAMMMQSSRGADVSRIYFGTDTRVFALLGGCALASALTNRPDKSFSWRHDQLAGLFATIGLLLMAVWVGRSEELPAWMFRGGFVFSTLLCIVMTGSAASSGWLSRILSVRPLVKLGQLSYSLYLWHWPIFIVLSSERTNLGGVWLLGLRFIVTIAVSLISLTVIERPLRMPNFWNQTRALLFISLSVVTLIGATVLINASRDNAVAQFRSVVNPPSQSGDPIQVLSIGDSIATTLFQNRPVRLGWQLYKFKDASIVGCGVGPINENGVSLVSQGKIRTDINPQCSQQREFWESEIDEFRPDVVVALFGPWDLYDIFREERLIPHDSIEFEQLFQNNLESLREIVIKSNSTLVILTTPCLGRMNGKYSELPEVADIGRREKVNAMYQAFADRHPDDVKLIDFSKIVCPSGNFTGSLEGITYTKDGVHFTPEGASIIWSLLDPIFAETIGLYNSGSGD
jgi:peptidoglycan/LPS O-acetylase OafA/YrhL